MHATNTCTYLTARLSLELNLVSREMKKTIRFNKIEREIQKTDLGSLKDKNETKKNLDLIPPKNQEKKKKKTCKRKNARNRMAVSREKLFSESASSLRDPPHPHAVIQQKNRNCWHYHFYLPIPWVHLLLLIQQKLKVRVKTGIFFFSCCGVCSLPVIKALRFTSCQSLEQCQFSF